MTDQAGGGPAVDVDALLAAFEARVEGYKKRIDALEAKSGESFWQRMSGRATAAALFLGLILTGVSIYSAVVTEPEKARVDRIAQFDEAVNSAAKVTEDLQLFQIQNPDPSAQYTMANYSNTQISIDLATAQALLQDIDPADVGVSQLMVLMDGAFSVGDLAQARRFLDIARAKQGLTPVQQAGIARYTGRYDFYTGDIAGGRASYLRAAYLPVGLGNAGMYLGELTYFEIGANDCRDAAADLASFVGVLNNSALSPVAHAQLLAKEREVLREASATCPIAQYQAMLPPQ